MSVLPASETGNAIIVLVWVQQAEMKDVKPATDPGNALPAEVRAY